MTDGAVEDRLPALARAVLDEGSGGVAARVVDIQGFSTWPGDELVVVDRGGVCHGAVLGAAGAERIVEAARPLLGPAAGHGRDGLATAVVEIHGAAVAEAGLSCGGRAELLLQPTDTIPTELWQRLAARAPVALLTRVDGQGRSATSLAVDAQGTYGAALDPPSAVAVAEARALLAGGHSATRRVEDAAGTVLVEAWVPAPRLVVIGTGEMIGALD
ncbi:MAG TPA: hypothetical protein VKV25_03425, partial [Acidimicrobiales bacterium]|nr:hypothetical protein [Acidimicrobiales bacterium]